ncbi:zinc finger protein ZPR1-like [Convolutriloba macropyga]|uniref:zinc finger protein ZPR1-like n=1 Tax=Convolutriloba macropyga TaxID=536237 RepID=UPI003F527F1B
MAIDKPSDDQSSDGAIFAPLGSDEIADNVTCVESLCMSCYKQGETKLLLTKIPFYRDVVVSSFRCEECHFSNTQVQSCEAIQNRGVRYEICVNESSDLNRQVVKGEHATISVPQVNLEIPPESQAGSISTIEGVIQRVIDGLEQDQKIRQLTDPDSFEKVKDFVTRLRDLKDSDLGFDFVLDDPSGNSFVENPSAPNKDHCGTVSHYIRSLEQDNALGMDANKEHDAVQSNLISSGGDEDDTSTEVDFQNEVLTFSTNCPSCGHSCDTNMKSVKIPFFKEVIIMATVCDNCGQKSDEVKSGVGIEPKGVKYTCRVQNVFDLNRDVLKSETCSLAIPELEVELEHGSLGGRFTTIEGLVNTFLDGVDKLTPFGSGDSTTSSTAEKLTQFRSKAHDLLSLKEPFTIVLDDPAGNSFVSKAEDDDQSLVEERYERTYEQNEFLGLNDMKTENYEEEETQNS